MIPHILTKKHAAILFVCLLVSASAAFARGPKPALAGSAPAQKPIYSVGVQLETHSDQDSPDDYIYNIVSVTKQLQGRVIGQVHYLYKYNTDKGSTGGNAAGFNLIRIFSKRSIGILGYTHTSNYTGGTRSFKSDRDRWRLGYYYKIEQKADGRRLLFTTAYNTQTDWSESQTLDLGFSYHHPFSSRWSGDAGLKYTHAFSNVDMHIYNQFPINFTYKAAKDTDINLGYLFVDKTFSVPASSIQPDDDHVFRLGVKYTYK
ncbi:MAG: hypothetical protein ABIH66_11505 [bacterium]